MEKIILQVFVYLLFVIFLPIFLFGQTVNDSLLNKQQSLNDSLKLVAERDSLRRVNQKTIEHVSEIFSKFKNKRPKIGVVLAGGGAKGFAHVGVLELLDSLNIPIDYVAGNSMGGLIGGLYSIGYTGKELERFSENLDWNYLLNDNPPRAELPFLEKEKTGKYQLRLGLKGYEPAIPAGLIYGQNIQMFFIGLTAPYEGVGSFDDLPIPFRCVAVDLVSGKQVVLKDGSLSKAMRATMSIPSAFSPVDWGDYLLVDGLVLNNFPADVVRDMGADIIIGLNLTTGKKKKEDLDNLLSILDRTTDIPMGAKLQENIEMSDIYISQDLEGFGTSDFAADKIKQIIGRGKRAGQNNKEVLIALKKELEKYDEYIEWEKLGKKEKYEKIKETKEQFEASPPIIHSYVIQGNKKFSDDFISLHLGLKVGNIYDYKKLSRSIDNLYAMNYFEKITYTVAKSNPNEIDLVIEVKEKLLNRLVAGFKYNDYYKLIGLLGLETNSALIPGAQLETYLQFGGLTKWDLTVLYPSRSMDMVVYPFLSAQYQDIPIDFYFEGKKIFRFRNLSWKFYGGFNFSLSKFWNLEGSVAWESMNVYSEIATPIIDTILAQYNLKANIVTGRVRLLYDSIDDIIIPNKGIYFNSLYEGSSPTFGSDFKYHRVFGRLDIFIPFAKKHNIKLEAAYMKAWNKEQVPFYKWFYLGGPETFVGLDYFQASGTEFTVAATSYRYEILESIYLKGIFNVIFNYSLLDGPKANDFIFGYGISAMMRTIFGRMEVMWARGDANVSQPGNKSNKVYFLLGYNL
ncbi:putative patatin-like phospholipase [hydrothermal vent metagenome]|uniref:Putative patatin-like phospholipase n=1 Tax=hydrothermal vent metagenome TaxID=652676 RepID=A0A3B1CRX7_9ZZZZ